MAQFTWPYQFLEDMGDREVSFDIEPGESLESIDRFSIDIEAGTIDKEPTAAEPVQPESADLEPVDGDSGTTVETGAAEDAGSEVSVGSAQPSSDDLPASDDDEYSDEDNTAVQAETVEESSDASALDTSTPEIEESSVPKESAAAGDSTLEVVTEVETEEADADLSELRAEAEAKASSDPVRDTSPETTTVGSRYHRAPAIRNYALARAGGICECCGDLAPFKKPSGEPYLEVHHVDELGEGGEDHPDKVVSLCPVCHKRVHHGKDGPLINSQLAEKLDAGLADVGVE